MVGSGPECCRYVKFVFVEFPEAIGGYGQIRNRTHFFSLGTAERNLYNSKPR